jgi:hypothetical protein
VNPSAYQALLFAAAALIVIDPIGYSVGALAPIHRALALADPYWRRRLTLNLPLANQGLYFAGIAALLGAVYAETQPQAASALAALCFLTCAYTVVTVGTLTPKDWTHVLPRAIAAVLILAAWGTR